MAKLDQDIAALPSVELGLRQRAEAVVQQKTGALEGKLDALSPEDVQRAFQELRVFQIELEMQNDELRRTQLELDRAREHYFDLYDLAPVGYVTVNDAGIITESNLATANMLGIGRNELSKQRFSKFVCQEDQDSYWLNWRRTAKASDPLEWEMRLIRADRAPVWVQVRASLMAGGETWLSLLDISKRKNDEQAELARVAAEQASHAKSKFLATMSHEIRTPLAAIVGFCDLLVDETINNPQAVSYVETIKRNSTHLAALVDDILDVSKIEANQCAVEVIPSNLRNEIETVMSVVQQKANDKGIALLVNYASDVPKSLLTDPTRLRQILINILGNAVKFTDQGAVCLTVEQARSPRGDAWRRVMFTITDTGCGIPSDQHNLVFDPFSQATRATTRIYGGTGLGLTLSRHLARLLNGDVVLKESVVGEGSTFIITIDAQLADVPMNLTSAHVGAGALANERPFSGKSFLVVDDSPDNQLLIQKLLQLQGADVCLESDGLEGSEIGATQAFDAIIMDMSMPVVDGYEATRRLRRRGVKTPVIALTAHATQRERDLCLDAGCDDYRTKPIKADELYEVVGKWCGREHRVDMKS